MYFCAAREISVPFVRVMSISGTLILNYLLFSKTWYIPGPAPVVSTLSNLKLLSKEKIRKDDLVKLKFEINGNLNS